MKVMKSLLLIGAVVTSFAPQADVNIELHRDIAPIVIDGEKVGFTLSSKSSFQVPNGVNQVVVRISKLIENRGEREKYNSDAYVLTFTESDESVTIKPGMKITREDHAEQFDTSPQFLVTDKNQRIVENRLDRLPSLGGLTRDYEAELDKYNEKHFPELLTSAVSQPQQTSPLSVPPMDAQEQQMFEYWVSQTSQQEIDQFTELAFEARNQSQVILPDDASQPLEMLGYWYNKADSNLKKKLLSYLVSL